MKYKTSTKLTIGKVAAKAGIGIETIRFYEREKILPNPMRDPNNGYRLYDETIFKRLSFIAKAKQLGFTLKETLELLELEEATSCSEMQSRVDIKLDQVREKIRSLENLEETLQKLSNSCPASSAPLSECPILSALES